jgi:BexC/CtrB/KpsE family polysaccharide export inner-membrane protein
MQSTWTRIRSKLSPLLVITVIIPGLVAILYYGLFASDVYISESKFVVRSPDKPAATGVGILLKTAGFSNANDELYAAHEFIKSRDALRDINSDGRFARSYSAPTISVFDRFAPMGYGTTFEDLFKYYNKKTTLVFDSSTSMTTLSVRAYNADDAKHFNERLLELAERTVNRLNARGREDLVNQAQSEVDNAQVAARQAAAMLARYRNRAGVVDPEKQAAFQLQMVSKLQDELIANRTQLAELRKYAPQNPQVASLRARIDSLRDQIDSETGKVAGNNRSLSSAIEQYQVLSLNSQYADKRVGAALASLQESQSEARRKQAYVERVVQPNLPDRPLEPKRLNSILVTFILGFVAWGILSMLLAGVREHKD